MIFFWCTCVSPFMFAFICVVHFQFIEYVYLLPLFLRRDEQILTYKEKSRLINKACI
jgi:hypothetical protein